jgi:hypothetical protein
MSSWRFIEAAFQIAEDKVGRPEILLNEPEWH